MRRSAAVQAPLPASVDDALCSASSKKKSVVIITMIPWGMVVFAFLIHPNILMSCFSIIQSPTTAPGWFF
jgi:hypothetical protein